MRLLKETRTVNLLWTSGWDSTFRLLTLAANENTLINIFYIMQEVRGSLDIEMHTMDSLLKEMKQRFPGLEDRICSITHFKFNDIVKDPEIEEKYAQLNLISPFGAQYTWLAEFAKMHGIYDMEMSIAANDGRVYVHLENVCEIAEDPILGEYYQLSSEIGEDSPYSMFRYFRFPTMMYTKLDMKRIAEENGVIDILKKSWFCYTPIKGKPCGQCNPCRCAMEQGMSFRLPWQSKIRYHSINCRLLRVVFRSLKILGESGITGLVEKIRSKKKKDYHIS